MGESESIRGWEGSERAGYQSFGGPGGFSRYERFLVQARADSTSRSTTTSPIYLNILIIKTEMSKGVRI